MGTGYILPMWRSVVSSQKRNNWLTIPFTQLHKMRRPRKISPHAWCIVLHWRHWWQQCVAGTSAVPNTDAVNTRTVQFAPVTTVGSGATGNAKLVSVRYINT